MLSTCQLVSNGGIAYSVILLTVANVSTLLIIYLFILLLLIVMIVTDIFSYFVTLLI